MDDLEKSKYLIDLIWPGENTNREEWPDNIQAADLERESWWYIDDHWMSRMPDLYDKYQMDLAWKVLGWARQQDRGTDGYLAEDIDLWLDQNAHIWGQFDASRLWLDEVCRLSIQRGIIDELR